MNKFSKSCEFAKVDEELGLVMGYAIVCKEGGEDYFDLQGDHIPEDSMLKEATDFSMGSRTMKVMHQGGGAGVAVFLWPLTTEVAKAFEIKTERTGLLIAAKFDDEGILEKFKDGTFTGFSIGGEYGETEEVE